MNGSLTKEYKGYSIMASFTYQYFLDHIAKRLENNDYYFEREDNKFVFYIGCPCKQEDPAVAYLSCEMYQETEEEERPIKYTFCLATSPDKTFLNVPSVNHKLFTMITQLDSKYAKVEKIVFKVYLK